MGQPFNNYKYQTEKIFEHPKQRERSPHRRTPQTASENVGRTPQTVLGGTLPTLHRTDKVPPSWLANVSGMCTISPAHNACYVIIGAEPLTGGMPRRGGGGVLYLRIRKFSLFLCGGLSGDCVWWLTTVCDGLELLHRGRQGR